MALLEKYLNEFIIDPLPLKKLAPTTSLKSFLIDPENRVCVFTFRDKDKQVIRCHEEDRFDWRVAFGVAVSRRCKRNLHLQYLRKRLREKQYYLYCFNWFFNFDVASITKSVEEYENEYKEQQLKEQLRKYECELRKQQYQPKKISRKFKEVII